jgi:CheY-like chemotaxis protein/anti-sigma regulatory factor (Ser/Thr protein kinase)
LLGLINDVLDLAKIESGGLQVARAPFDLLQELRDIGHLFGAHARAKKLALQCELALATPTVVEGDRNKVGQIVANLLGNALKFTDAGHIGLHAWREGDRIWIEVSDTGIGMAEAELEELFVPFRQGPAGQEKGGTGLGLALSRDMARAMGGELVLRSTPGIGTQARVWLPLPPATATGAGTGAGTTIGEGAQALDADTPCTALVIEDDADSRVVLVNLLRSAGCTVEEAHDGREGLARCRDARFDIVFSDIRMPNMNGVELIQALRADPATRTLPVVAVSASSLEHERRFYIERGFQDFIGKPYPFHEVYQALVDYAGVRLRPAEETPAAAAPPPTPAVLATSVLAQLRDLIAAAAGGKVSAVARLMTALRPEAIGHERWADFDEAAQAYDFQLLEQRARELLALAEAVDRGVAGTGVAG